jgi:hypothetical protein
LPRTFVATFARKDPDKICIPRATRAQRSVYSILMEAMRQSWTDERLDDGFDRVDADLCAIRGELSSFRVETNERFDRIEKRFDRAEQKTAERFDRLVARIDQRFDRSEERFDQRFDRSEERFDQRFDRSEERFDQWKRLLFQVGGGMLAGLLGVIAVLFGTIVHM